jgi:peptidoglycan/LPS O-acetylase OafA/YrhL
VPSTGRASRRTPWNLDRGSKSGEMGYLPGLDGIRALAVIGVLLYHADVTGTKGGFFTGFAGGFLGVDVFFVLSGFLITTLIVEEFARSGRINFGQFYLRRARRLLPALFLVLAVVAVIAAFFYHDAAQSVRTDGLASLLYVTNWWFIFQEQSYFTSWDNSLLQHLWSLAVEEQFYLIWPVIALVLLKWRGRKAVFITALALSIASTVWMFYVVTSQGLLQPGADPSRAYFGTDTHVMGLLLGAAMAIVWRPGRLKQTLNSGAQMAITFIGFASLVTIIWIFIGVPESSHWLYQGGFLAISFIVCLLIAGASHPGAPFGKILGAQPMRWFGQRSYGLYLWHWPIFLLLQPVEDIPITGVWNFLLRMALTCGLAELSYRFVELPIRRGAIGRTWKNWRATPRGQRRVTMPQAAITAVIALVTLGVTGVALAAAPAPMNLADDYLKGRTSVSITKAPAPTSTPPTDEPTSAPSKKPSGGASSSDKPTSAKPTKNSNGVLTAIGDSVLLGVEPTLIGQIKGAQVDAAVSRQSWEVLDVIQNLKRDGLLAPIVVIHSGTNGEIAESELRTMLDLLADRDRVVVVNNNVPRPWMDANNAMINRVVPDYSNAVIADWYAASIDHPEYFVEDGTHPQWPSGIKEFVKLIRDAAGV